MALISRFTPCSTKKIWAPILMTIAVLGGNLLTPSIAQRSIDDYGYTTPLPQTGRVTIRQPLSAFNRQRMFAPCPQNSRLYAFAESTHYQVQICARQGVPRFYMSRGKQDSSRLTVEERNQARAQQLIFANGKYLYILYRDGARPERINAYLQVFQNDRQILGEALLYLYEG